MYSLFPSGVKAKACWSTWVATRLGPKGPGPPQVVPPSRLRKIGVAPEKTISAFAGLTAIAVLYHNWLPQEARFGIGNCVQVIPPSVVFQIPSKLPNAAAEEFCTCA